MSLRHTPTKVPIENSGASSSRTLLDDTSSSLHDQTTVGRDTVAASTVFAAGPPRIPPFWKHAPQLWFLQVEAQLRTRRLTSDNTRYDTLIAALDAETMVEVAELLQNPPAEDRYETLKRALITRFSVSEDKKLNTALSGLELGDQRPTQLLRRMTAMAGSRASEDVIRVRWLDLLPPQVQRCLKISKTLPLADLAELADELMESTTPVAVMATNHAHLHAPSPRNTSDSLLTVLIKEMADMKLAMAQLAANQQSSAGRQSRQRSRSRGNTQRSGSAGDKTCYYHRRFGEQARNCQAPCSFNNKQVAGN